MSGFVLLVRILAFCLTGISCHVFAETPVSQLQEKILEDQTKSISANRQGINDIYFIGFAPYSTEDVFMNEATYVRNLFDLQYDTLGRSILLVNNKKTLDLYPAATLTNLKKVFRRIGSVINPDEDIVVLYISSHGDKGIGVSLEFENMDGFVPEKDYLDAKFLLRIFDENNIKWRVVFLLACYSGGFIETLKNDNTLIITSASEDRPSFGCGHHGDFTQFGEVYFRNRLGESDNLITSFDLARLEIEKLEKQMGLKPSNPQIFIGKKIRILLESMIDEKLQNQ